MNKVFLFAVTTLLLSMISCSKDSEEEEQIGMGYTGSVAFYVKEVPNCDKIEVFLSSDDSDITKTWEGTLTKITTGTASCNMTTGYVFTEIPYGKYKYNTNCGIQHVQGSITVNKECTTRSLKFD